MIYIITTLTVPYVYHLPTILTLPSGFRYRFRYRRKYLHFEGTPREAFLRQEALIWLRFPTGDEQSYIPIRRASVNRVRDYGEVVFFELRLGQLPVVGDSPKLRQTFISSASRSTTEVLTRSLSSLPENERDKYVFPVKGETPTFVQFDSEKSEQETLRRWTTLVDLLGDFEVFRGVSFFRVVKIFDAAEPTKSLGVTEDQARGIELRLKKDHTYHFSFMQFVARGRSVPLPPPFDFSLDVDEAAIHPVKARERIDGIYDSFDFILRPKWTGAPIIRLASGQLLPEDNRLPDVETPVFIPSTGRVVRFLFFLLAVSVYLLALSPPVVRNTEIALILKIGAVMGGLNSLWSFVRSFWQTT